MLVLTRKQSETLHIGDHIVIKVIQTGRGSIKLGVEAPAEVRVTRGEAPAEVESNKAPAVQPSTRIQHPDRPIRPANDAGKHAERFHGAKSFLGASSATTERSDSESLCALFEAQRLLAGTRALSRSRAA